MHIRDLFSPALRAPNPPEQSPRTPSAGCHAQNHGLTPPLPDLLEFCKHSRRERLILTPSQEVTEPSSEDGGDPAPKAPAPPDAGGSGALPRAHRSACFRWFHPYPLGSAAETRIALTPVWFARVQDPTHAPQPARSSPSPAPCPAPACRSNGSAVKPRPPPASSTPQTHRPPVPEGREQDQGTSNRRPRHKCSRPRVLRG